MTTYTLSPIANGVQFFDNLGKPLAGGKIFTYEQNSSSSQATTWADGSGDAENTNPLVLDSSGRLTTDIWLDAEQGYNFVLTKSDGTTVLTDVNGVTGITSQNYIDTVIAGLADIYLPQAGGVITGGLTVQGSTNLHTTIVTGTLDVTSTLTLGADVAAGNHKITGLAAPVSNTDAATKLYVDTAVSGAASPTPAGAVIPFAANTPPTGWLECDGTVISRSTYSALFAVIGVTFGVGDGSTTFALPDMRGYFARGWDHGRGIDPSRTFGSNQADAFQNIIGYIGTDDRIAGGGPNGACAGAFKDNGATKTAGLAAGVPNIDTTAEGGDGVCVIAEFNASWSDGARTAAETRPTNVALMYIIKY